MTESTPNAMFYAFKGHSLSRKYYTSSPGVLSRTVFEPRTESRLAQILLDNGGCWPGLSGPGETFFRVVVGNDLCDHGWPLLFDPSKDLVIDENSKQEA